MSVSFEERVKSADLAYMSSVFRSGFDREWIHKGDRVRGELVQVPAPQGWQNTSHLLSNSPELQVVFATAYELAAFAADPNGWNGVDTVVAPGSKYCGKGHPCLRRRPGKGDNERELYVELYEKQYRINVLMVIIRS